MNNAIRQENLTEKIRIIMVICKFYMLCLKAPRHTPKNLLKPIGKFGKASKYKKNIDN